MTKDLVLGLILAHLAQIFAGITSTIHAVILCKLKES